MVNLTRRKRPELIQYQCDNIRSACTSTPPENHTHAYRFDETADNRYKCLIVNEEEVARCGKHKVEGREDLEEYRRQDHHIDSLDAERIAKHDHTYDEKKGIGNESRIRDRNEAMGRELENRTCTGQTSGSYSVRNEECLPSHTEQQSA